MKTSISILFFISIFCTSCMDMLLSEDTCPTCANNRLDTIDLDDRPVYTYRPKLSDDKYCNTEPRLAVEHNLSQDGLEYVHHFYEKDMLRFVPFGTAADESYDSKDIWTWRKTLQLKDWESKRYFEVACEDNPELWDVTYSLLRGARLEYYDARNKQEFKFRIHGVFESIGLEPTGIKGEVFEMMIKQDNGTRVTHIINYFTNDTNYYKYPCSDPSVLIKETTVNGKVITDFLTMEVAGKNDKYKVYYKKSQGIVLLQDLATGKYWESLDAGNL